MSTLPRDLAPMLATPGPLPPDDDRWAFEVKWDGVRALCAVEDGAVRLTSRAGNDITGGYPELARVEVPAPVLLDGEVVAFDEQGRTDFGRLQARMHVRGPARELQRTTPVHLLVFDVLQVGGQSLLDQPWAARREVLEGLELTGPAWQVPPAFRGDGAALAEATRLQGLEGVVAKRVDSRYAPGRRSEHWVKVKHVRRASAVVVGWKPGEGGRTGRIGSLLLGVRSGEGLVFAGHVGTGFSAATLQMLGERLDPLRRPDPPLPDVPREHARTAVWVEPLLVCDVDFTEWTREGRLRHPSFKGLRDDLDPAAVVRG